MGGFVNSKQGHVTSYARKQKINEMPAVSSEMSFDGRSLSVHTNILYILEIESLIYILPLTCSLCLSSFKFFWWAPQDFLFGANRK